MGSHSQNVTSNPNNNSFLSQNKGAGLSSLFVKKQTQRIETNLKNNINSSSAKRNTKRTNNIINFSKVLNY